MCCVADQSCHGDAGISCYAHWADSFFITAQQISGALPSSVCLAPCLAVIHGDFGVYTGPTNCISWVQNTISNISICFHSAFHWYPFICLKKYIYSTCSMWKNPVNFKNRLGRILEFEYYLNVCFCLYLHLLLLLFSLLLFLFSHFIITDIY